MNLSSAEKSWLPWWGRNGRFRLAWSCWLNNHRYGLIEKTFEGMAESRRKLLLLWFNSHWASLAAMAQRLDTQSPDKSSADLAEWLAQVSDFSELFIIDREGRVIASSYAGHLGGTDLNPAAVSAGLQQPFLHGPYSDPITRELGPRSSKFHDAVTLMFYQPIVHHGKTLGCLCGRIPNDAMSDILQREDGHVFRDSGDNYVFMAQSTFDPRIAPGTALSRSRFEDSTFSLGDNLKQGINTGFGIVRVRQHTELELHFTDPATGTLHPGVRETIKHGKNLFVQYPGYADYRHIPVIGKGITFTVPGSPDRWGMMCEGDLEEVYRRRSLVYKTGKRALLASIVTAGILLLFNATNLFTTSVTFMSSAIGWVSFFAALSSVLPLARRIDQQSHFLLAMTECGGSLHKRLEWDALPSDEIGELGRWINSFVDRIDQTVQSSLDVAQQVGSASASLNQLAGEVSSGSQQQRNAAQLSTDAIHALDACSSSVAQQSSAAESIASEACAASARGTQVINQAMQEMERTAQTINDLAQRIDSLDHRSDEINRILVVIKTIADQTNLLALNAAIEAARAGEQGRGFSVVAEEVRNLAQRTVNSTGEVSSIIDAIHSETRAAVTMMQQCRTQVDRGVALVTSAGEALAQINQGAGDAVNKISEIASATLDQLNIDKKIAHQVNTITNLAEQNNTKAKQALSAVQDLQQLSQDLLGAVNKFSL